MKNATILILLIIIIGYGVSIPSYTRDPSPEVSSSMPDPVLIPEPEVSPITEADLALVGHTSYGPFILGNNELPIAEYVLYMDGFYYYSDKNTLYRVDSKLNNKTEIFRFPRDVYQFFFDDEDTLYYVLYTNEDDDFIFPLYKAEGNVSSLIDEDIFSIFRIDDHYIYYIKRYSGSDKPLMFYTHDLLTGENKRRLDINLYPFYTLINSNSLYFTDLNSFQIYSFNFETGETGRIISDLGMDSFGLNENYVLNYSHINNKTEFTLINTSSQDIRMFYVDSTILQENVLDYMLDFLVYDDMLYFIHYEFFDGYEIKSIMYQIDMSNNNIVSSQAYKYSFIKIVHEYNDYYYVIDYHENEERPNSIRKIDMKTNDTISVQKFNGCIYGYICRKDVIYFHTLEQNNNGSIKSNLIWSYDLDSDSIKQIGKFEAFDLEWPDLGLVIAGDYLWGFGWNECDEFGEHYFQYCFALPLEN